MQQNPKVGQNRKKHDFCDFRDFRQFWAWPYECIFYNFAQDAPQSSKPVSPICCSRKVNFSKCSNFNRDYLQDGKRYIQIPGNIRNPQTIIFHNLDSIFCSFSRKAQLIEKYVKFECAFICPEVLTVVGGPGYNPGHES